MKTVPNLLSYLYVLNGEIVTRGLYDEPWELLLQIRSRFVELLEVKYFSDRDRLNQIKTGKLNLTKTRGSIGFAAGEVARSDGKIIPLTLAMKS